MLEIWKGDTANNKGQTWVLFKALGNSRLYLGPLLFNIFLCDMFLILKKDILYCGYADNTIFVRCYKSFRGDMSKPCKLVFK